MGIIVRGLIVAIQRSNGIVADAALKLLGERIRDRRMSLGWTQEELAERANIDRSYVGGVERGVRNLTFTVLCRLCVPLQCDVADLTRGLPLRL